MKKRFSTLLLSIVLIISLLSQILLVVSASNAYTINGVTVHWDDFSSSPSECWAYANNVYKKIWGHNFTNSFSDSENSLRNLPDSELTLTAEHLKAYVSNAPLGACLRICDSGYLHGDDGWGHSQIIVQKDAYGFTVFEGGLSASPYCREHYYTWSAYADSSWPGGYAYIKYIKWPGAPAYSGGPSASVSTSQSSVNLDIASHVWEKITISVSGNLPSSYSLKYEIDTSCVSCEWGDWNGNSVPLTIIAEKFGAAFIKISLIDKTNGEKVVDYLEIFVDISSPTVTISFDANGGSVSPTSKTAIYSQPYGSLPTPTKTNYTFDGWFTANGIKVTSSTNVSTPYNHTLYARWTSVCTTGHNYAVQLTSEPTLTSSGTEIAWCTVCGATFSQILPPLNPIDYTYSVIKESTCTSTGKARYGWKGAFYVNRNFDVTLPKIPHSYTNAVNAPTCTEKGCTIHTCSVCGSSYKDDYTDALDHSWDDGIITTEPTETSEGVMTFTCLRCDVTRTESIPVLSHTHNYTSVAIAPTCTEKGYTTYTCACGDSYVTDYVGALGHNFVGGVCTRCGEDDPNYNPPTPKDPCEGYTDINRNGWYHSAADFVISRGIMGSTKTNALTFEPNTACTRSMIVSILYRLSGSPAVTYEAKFPDIKAGQWYSDAVIWAYQNGIVSGYGDGKFGPNDKITREQMAVILKGYADFKGIDTSKIADLSDFPDANKVTWSKAAVRWAVAEGLISGKSNNGKTILDPQGNATRAEVASILMRFIQNILEK